MADRCPSNQTAISLHCPAGQRSAEIRGGRSCVDWQELTCLIKWGWLYRQLAEERHGFGWIWFQALKCFLYIILYLFLHSASGWIDGLMLAPFLSFAIKG